MAMLTCEVATCTYNENRYCCKGDIMVGGKDAHVCEETSCDSFRNQETDHVKSSVEHPSRMISIDCEATNCVYNANYKCHAQNVMISGCKACDCGETACATFKQK